MYMYMYCSNNNIITTYTVYLCLYALLYIIGHYIDSQVGQDRQTDTNYLPSRAQKTTLAPFCTAKAKTTTKLLIYLFIDCQFITTSVQRLWLFPLHVFGLVGGNRSTWKQTVRKPATRITSPCFSSRCSGFPLTVPPLLPKKTAGEHAKSRQKGPGSLQLV